MKIVVDVRDSSQPRMERETDLHPIIVDVIVPANWNKALREATRLMIKATLWDLTEGWKL